ncbi:alkaline phosphatase family protein [Flavobacteriaceae bacterium F89]|uniref:Alkaline phosphatase family protein n=1 Tax=Cerina litoralis TaxID=2874477 RepID=A0AAE3EWD0_9FLAO|nr:alkaline phosphatase family protein [Cerina litoralis]MCG2461493.1 alkaline phosphatase family protein [Cerina litoralis]
MKIKLSLLLLIASVGCLAQKKAENIILISVDGMRWQEIFQGADSTLLFNNKYHFQDLESLQKKYWASTPEERRQKTMPFFWRTIAAKGQLYGNRDLGNKVNVKNKYWFSYPGRSETLCGYYDPKIDSNAYPNNPNENVLEFLNTQDDYEGKVVTFASWDAVGRIVNRDRNGMLANLPGEEVQGTHLTDSQKLANELQHYLPEYFGKSVRFDEHTFALAKTYMAADHPKVLYIDFADPDDFGHAGQYDSYLDSAHYIDAMIASLWKMIQEDPFYKNKTAILVYPDHGRGLGNQWTSHGSETTHSDETWLAAMGPGVTPLGEVITEGQIYQDQIAQTAANLLGFIFTADHPVGGSIKSIVE